VSPRFPGARIALGTAQFGLAYGIANESGTPGDAEAARILALARAGGIDTLDTAIAYGDAEARLGLLGIEGFEVMSKLPPLPWGIVDVGEWVRVQVGDSLSRLRLPRLAALSLHRPADALGPRGAELLAALRAERECGRVGRLGVSVYAPEELEPLFAKFDFELVQAPANAFDRRLPASPWRDWLPARGCLLHLRSCFLQGLLLMPAERRPAWCARWAPLFARWDAFLRESGLPALEACLRHGLAAGADKLVLGVDSAAQLEAILAVPGEPLELPAELACDDPDLVNPSRWPKPEK
jgi:aryl-alcohol dehydrogenase-like predicted oxidoreductase